ncbi:Ubiquitin--protein ligase [Bertholletia excelsa]
MREGEMAIPHLFRCPISLDLLRDPVTLCTGQTYDRSSIERWFAAGKLTCPVTMQKLHDPSMVPNHTLRHLIDQWLQMGPQFDPNHHDYPDPSLSALKQLLESHDSSIEIKLQTLQTIQLLCRDLPSQNTSLIQLGFFPLLLGLAFGKVPQVQQHYISPHDRLNLNLKLVEEALVCALKLVPYVNTGPLNMLKEQSKLDYFIELFDHDSVTIKTSLCQLVEAIPSSPETRELCAMLGNHRGLLQRMISLLGREYISSGAGIKAILALCCLETNRENLVREGAVNELIECIIRLRGDEERKWGPMAMAALEQLVGMESGREAVKKHPDGVNAMVKMVFRVSSDNHHRGCENAVNSLIVVCSDSVEARERAICGGVLTQLLLLLQSQCSARTKTKARMLLKLLRSA